MAATYALVSVRSQRTAYLRWVSTPRRHPPGPVSTAAVVLPAMVLLLVLVLLLCCVALLRGAWSHV